MCIRDRSTSIEGCVRGVAISKTRWQYFSDDRIAFVLFNMSIYKCGTPEKSNGILREEDNKDVAHLTKFDVGGV